MNSNTPHCLGNTVAVETDAVERIADNLIPSDCVQIQALYPCGQRCSH